AGCTSSGDWASQGGGGGSPVAYYTIGTNAFFTTTYVTLATLSLPAGSWHLEAKFLIFNNDTFARTVKCLIWNGTTVTAENSSLDFGLTVLTTDIFETVMTLHAPVTLASPGSVTAQCLVTSGGSGDNVVGASRQRFVATALASVTTQ
ncbi:MAG TPA: hypothetical protein VFO27_14575, partial [Bryobacteraceae bacterium]|nr:hypothetical protein [Bryobacteraceae bacterium]